MGFEEWEGLGRGGFDDDLDDGGDGDCGDGGDGDRGEKATEVRSMSRSIRRCKSKR